MANNVDNEEIIEKRPSHPVATSCLVLAAATMIGALVFQILEIGEMRKGMASSDKEPHKTLYKKQYNDFKANIEKSLHENDTPYLQIDKILEEKAVPTEEKAEEKAAEVPKEEPKEEPQAETPKEEPQTDAPKEEPKEEPQTDAPKEEPKEEPKADAPKEEPKEEPKADAPKEEPKEEPKADAPKEEPKDAPKGDEKAGE